MRVNFRGLRSAVVEGVIVAVVMGAMGCGGGSGGSASSPPAPSPTAPSASSSGSSSGAASSSGSSGAAPSPYVLAGFGSGTTGGAGGTTVRVSDMAGLTDALCHKLAGGGCDSDPRIIEVVGTIDFTGSEGSAIGKGCVYPDETKVCTAPKKNERLLARDATVQSTYCAAPKTGTVIDISYDPAGNTPLRVGSNKTIIGVGADAGIKGKGLWMAGVSNVIIRNLTFSDINEGIIFAGDALVLSGVDRVWVDHNHFVRIGRQFLAGGFDPVTNTTISWNDFDGTSDYSSNCNGMHYWNVLMSGKTQTITFANNWFHMFAGRAPKIGSTYPTHPSDGTIHVVNNYFQTGRGHALDVDTPTKVLVEGNYFEDVDTPITKSATAGDIFGTKGDPDVATQAICQAALGRNCVGNVLTKTPSVDGFALKTTVTDSLKSLPAAVVVPRAPADTPAAVKAGAGVGKI